MICLHSQVLAAVVFKVLQIEKVNVCKADLATSLRAYKLLHFVHVDTCVDVVVEVCAVRHDRFPVTVRATLHKLALGRPCRHKTVCASHWIARPVALIVCVAVQLSFAHVCGLRVFATLVVMRSVSEHSRTEEARLSVRFRQRTTRRYPETTLLVVNRRGAND